MLAGILSAGAAPAIVKADSLMKIFLPSQQIIVGRGLKSPPNIIDDYNFMMFTEAVGYFTIVNSECKPIGENVKIYVEDYKRNFAKLTAARKQAKQVKLAERSLLC
jgi:hypothetical protein